MSSSEKKRRRERPSRVRRGRLLMIVTPRLRVNDKSYEEMERSRSCVEVVCRRSKLAAGETEKGRESSCPLFLSFDAS